MWVLLGVPVASFQEDGLFSSDTWMRYIGDDLPDDLTNLTLCYRVKLRHLRGPWNLFLSYSQGKHDGVLTAGD